MEKRITLELPEFPQENCVYKLVPKEKSPEFYSERTDRNIGFITHENQKMLKNAKIGIAGCGGMGGQLAYNLLRLGIGELRIADLENFDVSNLNRQAAATMNTIGKSKAFETARKLREITNDSTIVVYPMGITKESAYDFASGCDLIIDEIELMELEAPIHLHQAARLAGVTIFGCNTAGYGSHLFKFTPDSMTFEEAFGYTLEEASIIDRKRREQTLSESEKEALVDKLILMVAPEVKTFNQNEFPAIRKRLLTESKASILATNPSFATGFLGDHIVIHLTGNTIDHNDSFFIPKMPGYAYIDARIKTGKVVEKKWW